jgi:catechol 2,3-dioxygenase-like lactoylglutathione lyase family enzyme
MASRGIDHVGVTSSDLDRSLRFYRDLLGMTVLDRGVETSAEMATLLGCDAVEFAYADLDAGDGRVFELLQYHSPVGATTRSNPFDPGTPHLAVRVADLEAVRTRLAEAGTTVISHAPVRVDAPGTAWHGGVYLLTRDPDGVIVELVERQ